MTLFDDVVDVTSGPSGPLVRVKLVVAYDGSGFAGIAPQPGVTTVGGTLAAVLGRVLRQPVQLTVAGRTDAGVHAWGQVVTFDVEVAAAGDVEVGMPGWRRPRMDPASAGRPLPSMSSPSPGR